MGGNKVGGIKARETNLANDPDFYKRIGKKGGQTSRKGGFAANTIGKDGLTGRERARVVGIVGGTKSRRSKSKRG